MPKFQVYKDAAGKFRFHLRPANGQIIADSEGYEKKAACLKGIDIVRRTPTAETKSTLSETRTTQVIIAPPQVMVVEPLPQEGPDRKDEMLQELKKIRAYLETPPSPAPPKGLWNEFKDFLSKYKILGMAIAIVIGVYLGLLVQALVAGFLIPLIGLAIPGMSNLSTYMHNHTRPKIHSWRLPIGTNNVPNSRTYRISSSKIGQKMEYRLKP